MSEYKDNILKGKKWFAGLWQIKFGEVFFKPATDPIVRRTLCV